LGTSFLPLHRHTTLRLSPWREESLPPLHTTSGHKHRTYWYVAMPRPN